jgi:hypothetical protein
MNNGWRWMNTMKNNEEQMKNSKNKGDIFGILYGFG